MAKKSTSSRRPKPMSGSTPAPKSGTRYGCGGKIKK